MSFDRSGAQRRRSRRGVAAFRGVAALLLAATQGACADLQPLETGRCGNGVVEPERGEDCDDFAQGSAACRPKGSIGECRLDCSAAGSACPSSMGCGQDGLCRAPSGVFDTWGPNVDGAVLRLMAGDFDGDRRGDLLGVGSAGLSVSYFDPTGVGVKTTRIPAQAAIPAIGDLTQDGIDDIVQPLEAGLGVLEGSADRSLSPIAYSTDLAGTVILVPIDADSSLSGDETLALTGSTALLARAGQKAMPIAPLPQNVKDLAPRYGVGSFDPTLSCQEVALAWRKATSVALLAPCKPAGNRIGKPIALPEGAVVDDGGGVIAYRVDPDDKLDLVIWTKTGGQRGIAVAYGQGDGTFATAPPGEGPSKPQTAIPYASETILSPLAVGHLNDDGVLDFVDSSGVHVSVIEQGVVRHPAIAPPQGTAWDQAVIVDLNGNGISDVVASVSTSAGLDFYNGAGAGRFAYAKVPTTGAPTQFTVGDFDGDLVNDLAVSERGSFEVGGDSLSILFGQPAGPPGLPISFGRLDTIGQIAAQNTLQAGQGANDPVDAITDLVVVSYSYEATTTSRLSFFSGNSSRLLESPFAIYTDTPNESTRRHISVPQHVVTGHFSGGRDHLDVAVAGNQPSAFALWLLPATEAASLSVPGLPNKELAGSGLLKDTHLVPVNLGPSSGADSLVVLTRWKGGDDASMRSAVIIASPDGDQWSLGKPKLIGEEVARDDGLSGRALPCDVDGDGFVDVVVAAAPTGNAPGAAFVLWNDGTGDLDIAKRTVISNPDPTASTTAAGDDGRLTSVACLRTDRDAAGQVTVLLAGGAYVVKIDRATRQVSSTRKLFETNTDALEGGVDCVATDIDGDGLQDLAIADAAGLHVYRARPEVQ